MIIYESSLSQESFPCSSFVFRWRSLLQLWLARYRKAKGSSKDAKLKDHHTRFLPVLGQSHLCLSHRPA